MDKLKAEILSKRKARVEANTRPAKYMRRGDLEKLKEAENERTKSPSESRSLVMHTFI
jgi:pre-mRNA-splicing factor 18